MAVSLLLGACASDDASTDDDAETDVGTDVGTEDGTAPTEATAAATPAAGEECTDPDPVTYLLAASSVTLGSVGYAQVPEEMGYWEEECLDVNLVTSTQGSSAGAVAALETGQADLSVLGTLALINAVPEGAEQHAVFFTAFRNLGLFVLEGGEVQSFEDLAGKTAGADDLGTSAAIYCQLAAEEAGVTEDEWELISPGLDLAAAAESLRTGRLDAWCGIDSAGAVFRNNGLDAVRLDSPIDETLLPPGALVVSDSFLEENRDVVVRFIRATMKGMTFAVNQPEKATQIALANYPESQPSGDTKEEQLKKALDVVQLRIENSTPPGYPDAPFGLLTEDALQEGIQPWIDAGQVPEGMDLGEWADMSLIEEAAEGFDRQAIIDQAEAYEPPDF